MSLKVIVYVCIYLCVCACMRACAYSLVILPAAETQLHPQSPIPGVPLRRFHEGRTSYAPNL